MSSKALALCNVNVCEACECVCASVCINMCKCAHGCEYKRFTMERARAGCVQQGGEGVLGFICACLCLSAYTLTHVFVNLISAAAACKSLLLGDALIYLQNGAN